MPSPMKRAFAGAWALRERRKPGLHAQQPQLLLQRLPSVCFTFSSFHFMHYISVVIGQRLLRPSLTNEEPTSLNAPV